MARAKSLSNGKVNSTADLRRLLIDTISEVRSGSLDPKQARTVAALATTILNSARLDLDFLRFHAANESLGMEKSEVLDLLPQKV